MELPSDFIYVVIGLAIVYVSTRVLNAGTGHIFALILGYFLITHLKDIEKKEYITYNQETDYRLELLGAPSHFHLDINLINLFFSIIEWRKKNANNFDNAIKAVNNILKVREDSEKPLLRCVDNYEIAVDQSKIAMNMIHGLVYSIDHPILSKKLKKVLFRLQQLLERHIVAIEKNCQITESKKKTIDVNSRFIEDSNGPSAYDGARMSQFDYY